MDTTQESLARIASALELIAERLKPVSQAADDYNGYGLNVAAMPPGR